MDSSRYPSRVYEGYEGYEGYGAPRADSMATVGAGQRGSGGTTGVNPLLSPKPPVPGMAPIMVIDDSLVVRRVVEASFARVGIPTISFPDGLSAMNALVKGEAPAPELLLLDIGLPKMDGYEVAKILRTHPDMQETIIVMLTGRDGVFDRVRAMIVGARDYIKKPFRPAELVARVCALLRIPAPTSGPDRF